MPTHTKEQIEFHINILQEARVRNAELIATYTECRDQLTSDPNFSPTRALYNRLIDELGVSNQRLLDVQNQLNEELRSLIRNESSDRLLEQDQAALLVSFSGLGLQPAARSQDETRAPSHPNSPSYGNFVGNPAE
ncbi:MAG TPA: hypothetical protein DDY37_03610 [Legionella sp.]|nr:hypothetical protein [Legionella sp.]